MGVRRCGLRVSVYQAEYMLARSCDIAEYTLSGRAQSVAPSLFRLRADNSVQLAWVSATMTHPSFRQGRNRAGQQSLSCAAPLPRMDDINLMISINWVVGLSSN